MVPYTCAAASTGADINVEPESMIYIPGRQHVFSARVRFAQSKDVTYGLKAGCG